MVYRKWTRISNLIITVKTVTNIIKVLITVLKAILFNVCHKIPINNGNYYYTVSRKMEPLLF